MPAGGPGHVCRQAQGRYGDNHAADGDDSVRVHPNLQTRHAVRTTILLRATSARLACWVSVSAGAGTHGHRLTVEVRQPVTALRGYWQPLSASCLLNPLVTWRQVDEAYKITLDVMVRLPG